MIVRTVRERSADYAGLTTHRLVHTMCAGIRHSTDHVGAGHLDVIVGCPSILVAAYVLVKYDVTVCLVRVFLKDVNSQLWLIKH